MINQIHMLQYLYHTVYFILQMLFIRVSSSFLFLLLFDVVFTVCQRGMVPTIRGPMITSPLAAFKRPIGPPPLIPVIPGAPPVLTGGIGDSVEVSIHSLIMHSYHYSLLLNYSFTIVFLYRYFLQCGYIHVSFTLTGIILLHD